MEMDFNKLVNNGDGSRDLSPCVGCKKLVEDRHLYSREESNKEYCFDCFHGINKKA